METIVRNYKIIYFIYICIINGHFISISLSLTYVSPNSKSNSLQGRKLTHDRYRVPTIFLKMEQNAVFCFHFSAMIDFDVFEANTI